MISFTMSVRVEQIAADTDSVTSSMTGTQHGHGFTPVLRLLLWTRVPLSPRCSKGFLVACPADRQAGPCAFVASDRGYSCPMFCFEVMFQNGSRRPQRLLLSLHPLFSDVFSFLKVVFT